MSTIQIGPTRDLGARHSLDPSKRCDTAPPVLVEEDALETHFQPIVSLRSGAVFAVEALSRAIDTRSGRLISPASLFGVAKELDLLGELDRFCRRRAVERFTRLARDTPIVLSLNWDSSTLGSHGDDPRQLSRLVDRLGIPRSRVVIEILESRVDDLSSLVRFTRAHKDEGFLIAIDDYGTGHSTPERLARIEPDVIKIDRALVHGLARSIPMRETCRAVVMLARSLGALVVAEGVEDDADVVVAATLGIDLFQGFGFARPGPSIEAVSDDAIGSVGRILPAVRAESHARAESKRATRTHHEHVVSRIVAAIEALSLEEVDGRIASLLRAHDDVEALYALDARGVQLTVTAMRGSPRRGLFRAAPRGADQSLKDYFLELSSGRPSFVSTPYLSMATGNTCITYSRRALTRDGVPLVVCCDLPVDPRSI